MQKAVRYSNIPAVEAGMSPDGLVYAFLNTFPNLVTRDLIASSEFASQLLLIISQFIYLAEYELQFFTNDIAVLQTAKSNNSCEARGNDINH